MIKRIFLFLVLSLFSLASLADSPITQWSTYTGNNKLEWFDSLDATCTPYAAYATLNSTNSEATFRCGGVSSPNIYLDKMCLKAGCSGGTLNTWILKYITATPGTRKWCKSGVAPDLNKPLAEQCPNACVKGVQQTVRMNFGVNFSRPFAQSDIPSSFGGCAVDAVEFKGCRTTISTGNLYCTFVVENSGATSSVGSDAVIDSGPGAPGTETQATLGPVKAPNALPCPKGTVQAGMSSDGIPLCVGTGTSPPPSSASTTTVKPETSVTNADGSVTKTQVTEITNSDGSITTQTKITTVAADGGSSVKVTSSTGNTPAGAPGKAGANGSDAKGLCESNPNLSICRDSSVTGDCSAGAAAVACTGDAVQCAQLRYAAELACKRRQDDLDVKAMPSTGLGDSILGGTDPKKGDIDSLMKGTEVDMSKPQLDQAGFIAGGACLPNKTFSVMGKPVEVNFTQLCSNIQPLRAVIMACAFILAYLIVSRSVLQS